MPSTAEDIYQNMVSSIDLADGSQTPYKHWILRDCLPEDCVDDILALPLEAPDLAGVSGKRELHNATRTYFDEANQQDYQVVENVAKAFQSRALTDHIESRFGARLDGTYLRIEYAQDTGGFWLEPHTDLGVKSFTMLLYLSKDAAHSDLGTDIYDTDKRHVSRSPFVSNAAMIFVPSDITFHGFEKREITGIRKSLIINYVTDEWRAREQLAFPTRPIGGHEQ